MGVIEGEGEGDGEPVWLASSVREPVGVSSGVSVWVRAISVKVGTGDSGGRGLVVGVKVEIDRNGVLVGVPFWLIFWGEGKGSIGVQPERREIKPMLPSNKTRVKFRIAITGKASRTIESRKKINQAVLFSDYKPTA